MTEPPRYAIVKRSSARWEIVRLSSTEDFYVPLAECDSFSDAQLVLRGMKSALEERMKEIGRDSTEYECDWSSDAYGSRVCTTCGTTEGNWMGDPCKAKAKRVWVPLGSA